MRKFFAKIHLWLSVPLGILVSVICLSGATLVFEQEITRALDPQLYRVAPPEGVQPLAPSQLAARIREQMPDTLKLSSLQLSGDPREACMAGFEGAARRTLSVNPYTGEVNGWTKKYGFFQTTRKLHRWLMDAPAAKGQPSIGKGVVGVTTLLLVVILVSGLAIWVPRTRKALKQRLKVSCTNGWRRFWYDSHTVLGFYAALFLLAMALTGLTWSFGWYREAAYSLFGGGAQQTAASSQPAKGNSVRPARGGEGGRGGGNGRRAVRLCRVGRRAGRIEDAVSRLQDHHAERAQRSDRSRSAHVDASHGYGAVRSARRPHRGSRPLSGCTPLAELAGVVLCLPHRIMGRDDDQDTLFPERTDRRYAPAHGLLSVAEEKTSDREEMSGTRFPKEAV